MYDLTYIAPPFIFTPERPYITAEDVKNMNDDPFGI